MIVSNNDILWSASDLTRAAECEFSLLRQLDVKLGRIPAAKPPSTPSWTASPRSALSTKPASWPASVRVWRRMTWRRAAASASSTTPSPTRPRSLPSVALDVDDDEQKYT